MAVHRLPSMLPCGSAVKVKSYNVIRAVWRSVVGGLGGNIDASRRKSWTRRSTAKLAAYLSKYMVKAFEDGDDWSNRYSASKHTIPEAVKAVFRGTTLAQMIELAYAFAGDGLVELQTYLSRFGDTFYIASEVQPVLSPGHIPSF